MTLSQVLDAELPTSSGFQRRVIVPFGCSASTRKKMGTPDIGTKKNARLSLFLTKFIAEMGVLRLVRCPLSPQPQHYRYQPAKLDLQALAKAGPVPQVIFWALPAWGSSVAGLSGKKKYDQNC